MSEKLVRDKMPKLCETTPGYTPMNYRIAAESEMRKFLFQKLKEEASEVANTESDDQLIEELADILEVVRSIQYHCGVTEYEILRVREEKFYKRGSFYDGIIWDGNK